MHNSQLRYLEAAVANGDLKSLLVFLTANAYLKKRVEDLMPELKPDELQKGKLTEKIEAILKTLNIQVNVPANAPAYQKEAWEDSVKGYQTEDLKKTYQFIEQKEREGQGFHLNFLLENLIEFFSIFSFERLLIILSDLREPVTNVFFLQGLAKSILIRLSGEPALQSEWLHFEIIRQMIKKEAKDLLDKDIIEALRKSGLVIKQRAPAFFGQVILYLENTPVFNAALGEISLLLSDDELKQMIRDHFTIDRYAHEVASKKLYS